MCVTLSFKNHLTKFTIQFFQGLQTGGSWFINCRNGAKIVIYREELLLRTEAQERILLLETNTPDIHAEQALRVMAQICQVKPENLVWTDLTPKLPFFLSKATDCMMQGLLYNVDPEMFAIGVQHTMDGMEGEARSIKGRRGSRWMPLNLIAFAASFVRTFSLPISVAYFLTSFLASHGASTHRGV